MKLTKKPKNEKRICFLFFLYIFFILKVIVFKFSFTQLQMIVNSWRKDIIWEGLSTANFTPLKTIKMYIRYYSTMPNIHSFENLFGNICVFVPFGFMLPMVHPPCKNIFILFANTFLFVLGIEIFQLFSAFGAFDVDDILLNSMGSLLGYGLYKLIDRFGGRDKEEHKN